MNYAIIDFETYNTVPISVGASKYSLTAEVLCLAYSINGAEPVVWTPYDDEDPYALLDAVRTGYTIIAHNAAFERAIWKNVCVAKYEWPAIFETQWQCTMAEGLAMNLPAKLEEVGKALGVAELKDTKGHKVMQKMTKPRKPTKNNPATRHETPEDWKQLIAYCAQDVRSELANHNKLPRLCNREQQVFWYDSRVNERGVKFDVELAQAAVAVWRQYEDRLIEELRRVTDGAVKTPKQVAVMTNWLRDHGVQIDDMRKESISEALEGEGRSDKARRVLEIRQELALSSVAKYEKVLACVEPDQRIRGCFQYSGAGQTQRWAGRLVQLQNLPQGKLNTEDLEEMVALVKTRDLDLIEMLSPLPIGKLLSSLIRSLIIADEGKKLIVSDFAAVEGRGLAWATGEKWLIDAFATGTDVYKGMASAIYHKLVDQINKAERQVGKVAILGCGYGMGASKFWQTLQTYGIHESVAFADEVVNAYRAKNPNIKRHWYATEAAAVNAVKCPGTVFSVGPFKYYVKDGWLRCRMPAGRDICYYQPELRPGKFGMQVYFKGVDERGKMSTQSTYGGKLVENNTQSLCRDVLVDAMSRLERRGYSVIGHVHDEVITEVDEDFGSPEEMTEIMSEVPSWCQGFPIGAESWEAKRYRK